MTPITESQYQIDTKDNRDLLNREAQELVDFGKRFAWPGGGASYLDDEGNPVPSEGLYAYESGRYAHAYTLGLLAGYVPEDEALPLIKQALDGFTTGLLLDREHGGWYTRVGKEGTPDPNKGCYAHAFVILGAASASLVHIPESRALLDKALKVYDRYFWDEQYGMPRDTWDTSFTHCEQYRGINSSMHSVEAFLAASDALEEPKYRLRAGRMIQRTVGFASDCNWHIPEHFTEEWKPVYEYNAEKKDDQFKPYGTTPGHSLEWGRLITQWAVSSYDHGEIDESTRDRYIEAAENLFAVAVETGWNVDGQMGLVYTVDWEGRPVVHDRMHWTLAEGIDTASVLYRITGKSIYAEWYARFWQYVDEYMIDHQRGSWFHQLDANNQVIGTVWPGKPDIYHALQATLIPCVAKDRIGLSIAKALTD